MAWNEKPPMLTGQTAKDVAAIRDYLFRVSNILADLTMTVDAVVGVDKNGHIILKQPISEQRRQQ